MIYGLVHLTTPTLFIISKLVFWFSLILYHSLEMPGYDVLIMSGL